MPGEKHDLMLRHQTGPAYPGPYGARLKKNRERARFCIGDFNLIVPRDCVASNTNEENFYTLDQMNKVLKADTRPSAEIPLEIEPQSSEARSRSTPRVG